MLLLKNLAQRQNININNRKQQLLIKLRLSSSCCGISSNYSTHELHRHDRHSSMSTSSIAQSIKDASTTLPQQAILENFVHHNPYEHLQSLPFKTAIDLVHALESHPSPAARVFQLKHVDPRKRVNEAMVDLCSVFLDRGAAKWAPRFRHKGFLHFFATLEGLGFAPWRRHARSAANDVLSSLVVAGEGRRNKDGDGDIDVGNDSLAVAELVIQDTLQYLHTCVPSSGQQQQQQVEVEVETVRAMLMELRGWAGMFKRMESHPAEAPTNTRYQHRTFLLW